MLPTCIGNHYQGFHAAEAEAERQWPQLRRWLLIDSMVNGCLPRGKCSTSGFLQKSKIHMLDDLSWDLKPRSTWRQRIGITMSPYIFQHNVGISTPSISLAAETFNALCIISGLNIQLLSVVVHSSENLDICNPSTSGTNPAEKRTIPQTQSLLAKSLVHRSTKVYTT